MNLHNGCSVYGHSDETTIHIMFQCKLRKDVWYRVCLILMEYVDRFVRQATFWQSIFDLMVREDVFEQCMVTC